MHWYRSHRFDPVAARLADRHYTRRKVGAPQFVPPGREVTLRTADGLAVWTSSWPYAVYVKHAWAGAWICSIFRNEGEVLSSQLIREAVAATLAVWPEPPLDGIVTFVNTAKVRKKRDWGRCFRKAGWEPLDKRTKGGLFVLRQRPECMPAPCHALDWQLTLF